MRWNWKFRGLPRALWPLVLCTTCFDAHAGAATVSDQQIKEIAYRYGANMRERETCRFTPEDLYEEHIIGLRTGLNPDQQTVFDEAVYEAGEPDMFGFLVDDAWCKDARERLRALLGK